MSEGPFTLRSLGERAESAFQSIEATAQSTATTLQNDAVVDWPLWVFGVGALVALFFIGPISAIVREVLGALWEGMGALARLADPKPKPEFIKETEDARLKREGRGPYSTDERERLRWFNREGEFAPGANLD